MSDQNRDAYLNDGSGLTRVEPDHDKIIPPYLWKEAAQEEAWEKAQKDLLEVSSWAREFKNKFLDGYKVQNRQMVQVWEPEKAASWLKEKVLKDGVFSRDKCSEVLGAAQCMDEKRVEVMRLIGENDEQAPREPGSPTITLKDVDTPPTAREVQDAYNQRQMADLKKRAKVGSYGILLSEQSCQLYRDGEKRAELSTEDCGGYGVLASEIDALASDADVEAFFDLRDDTDRVAKIGWLRPKGAPVYDDPTYQRDDQLKGDTNVFDKANIPQSSPGRADPLSQGPTSVTPGAATPNAPQIPGQDDAMGQPGLK